MEARTLAEYLAEKGIDAAKAIVEYRGEVYAPGSDLASVAYEAGTPVDIFKVVAGG